MNLSKIPTGKNVPEDVFVIIEIPSNSNPVKYEINKNNGIIFVDRFIETPVFYPCNYGYINNTLSLDNDPLDALVITSYPLISGCVILCKPIGLLKMSDESGFDTKIIAVPHDDISKKYKKIKDINDLSKILRNQINYFFKHYKDLDIGKWSEVKSWENSIVSKQEIINSVNRFKKKIK